MESGGQAIRYIVYGQLAFLSSCIVCLIERPENLFSHSGVSLFGNFRNTLLPFVLGLVALGICMYRAAEALQHRLAEARLLRNVLYVSAFMIVGIICTPSLMTGMVEFLHRLFGMFLFGSQALVSIVLCRQLWQYPLERTLLCLQAVLFVVFLLSFNSTGGLLRVMVPAQLGLVTIFTILAVRVIGRLRPEPVPIIIRPGQPYRGQDQ